MRILFLSNGLRVGGVEVNLVRLTQELCSRGHQIHVASGGGALSGDITLAGATHIPLQTKGGRLSAKLRDLRMLRRIVREVEPDLIQVLSASTASVLWFSRGFGLVPFGCVVSPVIVGALLGLQNSPEESHFRILMRAYVSAIGTDRVIASAPSIEAAFRRLHIFRRRLIRMEVVGIPIPPRRLAQDNNGSDVRRELGVTDEDDVITTIGNLVPSKSHHLFVSAASQVISQRPTARFFIVGEGPLRASLQGQIDEQGLQRHVFLLGQRTDVNRVLSATDVCVRPGIIEGLMGITVLEAQALDIPVVAFDTRDVRVAISHMKTGWIVPAEHPNALAQAIIRLLDDPELVSSLASAGREQVESRFSIAAVVDGLESFYMELVGRERVDRSAGAACRSLREAAAAGFQRSSTGRGPRDTD